MCTAISYRTKDHYFGRNLDLEISYGEKIVITPRNYSIRFRHFGEVKKHLAIIGMGIIVDDYPLYFDGTNESGLSVAGLNFPGNAHYKDYFEGKNNVASFEFIPWLLSKCKTISEVMEILPDVNITNDAFSKNYPPSPLHWIISDRYKSIVVEQVEDGLKIYDNPVGVLTNNPTFDYQLFNLNNYMNLSINPLTNTFGEKLQLENYSRGMGAMGLPGDLSSMSRFVRATFTKLNSVSGESEVESLSQFFHILGSVAQQRGLVQLDDGKYEITVYSSCCNTNKGIYYYTTYENSQINGIDMKKEDLEGRTLISYPLILKQNPAIKR